MTVEGNDSFLDLLGSFREGNSGIRLISAPAASRHKTSHCWPKQQCKCTKLHRRISFEPNLESRNSQGIWRETGYRQLQQQREVGIVRTVDAGAGLMIERLKLFVTRIKKKVYYLDGQCYDCGVKG